MYEAPYFPVSHGGLARAFASLFVLFLVINLLGGCCFLLASPLTIVSLDNHMILIL